MDSSAFDYDLPEELIAQEAIEPRDAARLLVVERGNGRVEHRRVRDLPSLLNPGDLIVTNDTRVIPARLIGRKQSGGRVEVFLLEREGATEHGGGELWRALIGASRPPAVGTAVEVGGDLSVTVLARDEDEGVARVRLIADGPVAAALERHGRPPLPPYIRREDDDPRTVRDRERYQTVFAREDGAVAAPTAGLHFTPALIARLERAGVCLTSITLHVGEGTFRTPRETRLERIALHAETYRVGEKACAAIATARRSGGRVVALGTTAARALESRPADAAGLPLPGGGRTDLFIRPGHRFRFVDILFTNFHLPRSTLLMLVAAFAGRERTLAAYAEAVREGYRFYSYGDAMLVL